MTAIVQVAIDTTAGVVSGTPLAMGSNVTIGNKSVVLLFHSYAGCSPSLADSQGNSYTKHVNNGNTGTGLVNVHCWSAPIGATGALSITPTFACGSRHFMIAYEVSGQDAFEGYANSDNTVNDVVAGSLTTLTNGGLVIGMFSNGSAGAYTPGAGYTERGDVNGYMVMDIIQTTAGLITPSATAANPATAKGYVFAFSSVAGASGRRRKILQQLLRSRLGR
jgi:hypothetical protein